MYVTEVPVFQIFPAKLCNKFNAFRSDDMETPNYLETWSVWHHHVCYCILYYIMGDTLPQFIVGRMIMNFSES